MCLGFDVRSALLCVTWLIYTCDMTQVPLVECAISLKHAWHDSFVCVTWLVCLGLNLRSALICMTWLVHMCDMTHLYVWHDSIVCVTWLILPLVESAISLDMRDMASSYVWHDSRVRVAWLIVRVSFMCLRIESVIRLYVCDMTHLYVWHDPCASDWMCDQPEYVWHD